MEPAFLASRPFRYRTLVLSAGLAIRGQCGSPSTGDRNIRRNSSLTESLSPTIAHQLWTGLEADDVDSISIYTAGIPAEYGRKMGGVVET